MFRSTTAAIVLYRQGNFNSSQSVGSPGASVVKTLPANAGYSKKRGFDPWVGNTPGVGMAITPSILDWKISIDRELLVDYIPWGGKELDTTGAATHTCTQSNTSTSWSISDKTILCAVLSHQSHPTL